MTAQTKDKKAGLKIQTAVFESGTLQTHTQDSVSTRLFMDVMRTLEVLMKAAYKDHDKTANDILGDIKEAADNLHVGGPLAQVHIDTQTSMGNTVFKILDNDRRLLPQAGQIIRDVMRTDPSITIGPEYAVSAQHYIDQLKVPDGHHIEIPEGSLVPVVVETPVPPTPERIAAEESFASTRRFVQMAREAGPHLKQS